LGWGGVGGGGLLEKKSSFFKYFIRINFYCPFSFKIFKYDSGHSILEKLTKRKNALQFKFLIEKKY
jgi:hypothetical protein